MLACLIILLSFLRVGKDLVCVINLLHLVGLFFALLGAMSVWVVSEGCLAVCLLDFILACCR
jgi:hypothetical protein